MIAVRANRHLPPTLHPAAAPDPCPGNGTLDFAEFLCLMYFWEESGDYSAFFRNPVNAQAVKMSFNLMERCMIKYDVDRSRTLQLNELDQFFTDHFKEMCDAGTVASIINAVHPNLAKNVMPPDVCAQPSFPHAQHLQTNQLTAHPHCTLIAEKGRFKVCALHALDLPRAQQVAGKHACGKVCKPGKVWCVRRQVVVATADNLQGCSCRSPPAHDLILPALHRAST